MFVWSDKKYMFRHQGKDYKQGDTLPDSIPAETLASLKKKGRIHLEKAATPNLGLTEELKGACAANLGLTEELKGACAANLELVEAKVALVAQLDAVERDFASKLGALTAKLEAAEKTIAELTAQVTKPKGKK